MSPKIRIGIIGLGGIAHMAHFDAFRQQPDCIIVAGCDTDERKFQLARAKTGLKKYYLEYAEMFAKEKLDAVVIGTPNFTHKPISIAALEAGINVLCEKPLACSRSEALEIQRTVRSTGRKFMVGMCFRFRNEAAKIKEYLDQGKLGQVYFCKALYLRDRGIPGWGTWFTDKSRAGGGVVMDLGVHLVDYFWFLLGKPRFHSVTAMTYAGIAARKLKGETAGFGKVIYPATYQGAEQNVFDVDEMVGAFIRFDNSIALMLESSWAMNIDPKRYASGGALFGDCGALAFSPLVFSHDEGDKMVHEPIPVPSVPSHNNQARAFLDYLHGRIDNPAPIGDGIEIMKILEAIYRSAAEKREIHFT